MFGGSARSAVRQVRMRTSGARLERRPDGTLLVTPDEQLREYPKVLTDRVAHWAREFPERVCIAKRDVKGEWRRLTYAQIWQSIRAVGEAAMAMVEEVRRQFRTIPGIMEGTGKPEYDKCVAISTQASLRKMMLPGAI